MEKMLEKEDIAELKDLQTLKDSGVEEGEKWEFKSDWESNEKTQRTLCAFANTSGGHLLIGVDYNDTANKIEGFPGVSLVPQLCEKAISIGGNINPRVLPKPKLIKVGKNRVVVRIKVNRSHLTPHMVGDGRYYLRAGSQNVPMPESLVDRLYQARYFEQEKALTLLEKMNYGLRPLSDKDASWLSICLCPLFLDDELIINTNEMKEFLYDILPLEDKQLGFSFRNTYFGYNWYIPKGNIGEPMPDDVAYLREVHHNGLFIFGTKIEEAGIIIGIVKEHLEGVLSMASELYKFVRYSGFLRMVLAISNIKGKTLVKGYQPNGTPLVLRRAVPLKEEKFILAHNLQTDDILLRKDKVLEVMLAKLQQAYGLEVYAQ